MTEIEKRTGEFWGKYLSCFSPAKWHGVDEQYPAMSKDPNASRAQLVAYSNRTFIHVHSKLMIVDDNCAINGSANLNERSVGGLYDSELAVYQWASAEHEEACVRELREFRRELWQVYMGQGCMAALGERGFESPELEKSVAIIRERGRANRESYMDAKWPNGATAETGYMLTWPLKQEKGHVGEYVNDQCRLLPATTAGNHQNRFFTWLPRLEDGPTTVLKAAACCNVRGFN